MDLDDRCHQRVVFAHAWCGIGLALPPFVKAGGRHLHRTATRRDRHIRALLGDEGEPHFGMTSFAKYAAARFKISFSIANVRFSRRSFTNSTRSSLVKPSRAPRSTSACFNQPRKQLELIPRSFAS